MSQQQPCYSETPIVTNSQTHKKDFFLYYPISAEQRELGVKSLSLFVGANTEPFLVIIHKMFFN